MAQEIFRFMTIRPLQEVDTDTGMKNAVNLNQATGDFIALLVQQKKAGSREGMEQLVQEFLAANDSRFIDSRKKFDSRFLSFYESFLRLEDHECDHTAKDLFIKIFHVEPNEFVKTSDFKDFFVRVTNSIVVAGIDQNIGSKVRSLLVSLAKTLGLIQKLADLPENLGYSKADFLAQIIILPEGIFPLPPPKQDIANFHTAEKERRANIAKNHEHLRRLAQELTAHRNAIKDLLTTFEQSTLQPRPPHAALESNAMSMTNGGARSGFMLSEQAVTRLSNDTKAVLANLGLEPATLDVARAITLLENQASAISHQLHANRSAMTYMVPIGNKLIPSDRVLGAMPVDLGECATDLGEPGPCPPMPPVGYPLKAGHLMTSMT